jgi:putative zinc finger protein/uncharacterized protein DUF5667
MKKMRQTLLEEATLNHKTINQWLDAYADGMLPDSQRARVEAHLRTCVECEKGLQQIQRLDRILDDMPPVPFVPFPGFWSKLEERLPNHPQKRAPFFGPARIAAAFALAVLASTVGVVALASDTVMPDNPLYPVKHVRQEVQLALAGTKERPRLELVLGKQRLQEAVLMVQRKRPDLALGSLQDFYALLVDATPRLETTPAGRSDTTAWVSSVAELETELEAVRNARVVQAGSSADDVASLDRAVDTDLNAVDQVETRVDQGGTRLGESPSTESPPPAESSASAQPGESGPSDAIQPATAPSPLTDTSSPGPSD